MKLHITDENLENLQRPNSGTLQVIDNDKSFFQVNVGKYKTTFYMVTSRRSRNFRENLGHWPDISAEQARDEAIALHGMIRAGKTPRRKTAGAKTLREAFDRSIALREMDNLITPDTANQYRMTFDRHLTKLGTYSLDEIHEDDIYDLKMRLKDSPYVFKFIRAMLSQVYRMNSLPSPFISVTVMRTTKRDTKIMDHHEWAKQVFALQNPVLRNFKLLSALTGVRAGNMQTVKREHVDLDEQTLFLPKTKTNKNVTLPLSAVACDLFDELIQYSEARNKSWVFFSRKDKPLRYATKTGHDESAV
ncbi:MAG: integrase family protein [Anderseniella sp.]|nr:integrase family protein [Anderseniella sp.]